MTLEYKMKYDATQHINALRKHIEQLADCASDAQLKKEGDAVSIRRTISDIMTLAGKVVQDAENINANIKYFYRELEN